MPLFTFLHQLWPPSGLTCLVTWHRSSNCHQWPITIIVHHQHHRSSSEFIKATNQQRVDAFLGHSKCCSYCLPDLLSFEELLKTSDQQLFDKIQLNQQHVLYNLLPPPSLASQNYDIRPCAHSRQIPYHTGHLTDCNFMTRMIFTDIVLRTLLLEPNKDIIISLLLARM